MRHRTEDEIITKAPIEAQLGDKKYQIKPLSINKQRAWRSKLSEDLAGIVDNFGRQADPNSMKTGLTGALLDFPEKLADLVFAYAPDLPKEEILENATEEQIAAAFSQIMAVAYPFLAQLGTVSTIVRSSLSRIQ